MRAALDSDLDLAVAFLAIYTGIAGIIIWIAGTSPTAVHAAGLTGAAVATAAALSFRREPARRDFFTGRSPAVFAIAGLVTGAAIIAAADLISLALTSMVHERGAGFPIRQVLTLYVPAVLHEELLFRGVLFQLLLRRTRIAAVAVTSLAFTALHAWNPGLTLLGVLNLTLGGVILALALLRTRSLLFVIALHLGWNVCAGPLLGHEVGGLHPRSSLLATVENGASPWVTGGTFGLEGGVALTLVELIVIAFLAAGLRRRE